MTCAHVIVDDAWQIFILGILIFKHRVNNIHIIYIPEVLIESIKHSQELRQSVIMNGPSDTG